jgi:hypothetical protein
MNRNRLRALLLTLLLLLLGTTPAAAEPAIPYALVNHTIDGGGVSPSGDARFVLSATAGQHDATAQQGAERFQLVGGYWGSSMLVEQNATIFLPIVTR